MERPITTAIQYLKGIGPKRAASLLAAGIATVEDLLYYFPRRYEDRTKLSAIKKLKPGEINTVKVEVFARGEHRSFYRRKFSIVEIMAGDETGRISCVWFNQPYLKSYFRPGQQLILHGKVELYAGRMQMVSPEFEVISAEGDESLNTGRIVPVYRLPEKTSQRYFRKIVKSALDEFLAALTDCLPYDIRSRNGLMNLAKGLLNIHFPETPVSQRQAYERLAFDEFFIFQLPLAMRKIKRQQRKGIAHKTGGPLIDLFLKVLEFKLTGSQEKVLQEIRADMASGRVMQRLLQGDVGSGKTVIATLAGIMAIQGGYQVAFMVPTEILARQHYEKISLQLKAADELLSEVRLSLLTGSTKKERAAVYEDISSGRSNFVIGTHALLEEEVKFRNLGLVVIDEQHKFGVGQRALLPGKNCVPDVLIMTATPIPRTLAITLYADLDVSVINELPKGRMPVVTTHFEEEDKTRAYEMAKGCLKKGGQVYIVYPVIDESYALDMSGAKKMYDELKKGEFRDFRVGLIHGKLRQPEQDDIMHKFKNKELDILVSTTVLEVGIDVPSATCMIIEHAERFGLSQLHQLRGRVGRGSEQSLCILLSQTRTPEAASRIEAMVKYSSGFNIAEEDLKIRGPGEFFGSRQHGLSELKIGNPLTQMQLLKRAREEAVRLVNADPALAQKQNSLLKQRLLQRFPEYETLMMVG